MTVNHWVAGSSPARGAKDKMPIYSNQSSEPYKLSRSRIENFCRCKKCFYLEEKLGISRPAQFPFNLNNAVDEYIDTRVAGFEISLADKEDFQDFKAKLVKRDMDRTKLIDIDQPTTVRSTRKPTDKLDVEIESDVFGQGQMQDDL